MTQMDGMNDPIDMPERDAPAGSAWHNAHRILLIVAGLALLAWIASGFYYVNASEVAVVDRMGEYLKMPNGQVATVGPGIHVGLPWPLDRVEKIAKQTSQVLVVNTFDSSPVELKAIRDQFQGRMPPDKIDAVFNPSLITADLNLVYTTVTLQYKVSDEGQYLTAVMEQPGDDIPTRQKYLMNLLERDLVATMGHFTIDPLLATEGSAKEILTKRIEETVTKARLGISVDGVILSTPHVSTFVKPYFDAVTNARIAKGSMTDQATAAARGMMFEAEARVAGLDFEAKTYRDRVVAQANAERARFEAVYSQAKLDPKLAWLDIWRDTLGSLLEKSPRVYVLRPGQRMYWNLPAPDIQGPQNQSQR